MRRLREVVIWNVARELARRHPDFNFYNWHEITDKLKPEAEAKVAAMSTLELLDAIGEALTEH